MNKGVFAKSNVSGVPLYLPTPLLRNRSKLSKVKRPSFFLIFFNTCGVIGDFLVSKYSVRVERISSKECQV